LVIGIFNFTEDYNKSQIKKIEMKMKKIN